MAYGQRESWITKHCGLDYGGRRLGNKHYLNGDFKHKGGKKKTHTLERAEERRLIYRLETVVT